MNFAQKNGKLKAVLDTNVYFSAFVYGYRDKASVPYLIWQRAVHGEYNLLVSPAIFLELTGTLHKKSDWQGDVITNHLKLVNTTAKLVFPSTTITAITEDDDDNRILECAVTGGADLIVSGDRHLTKLKNFQGIGIVRPIDFLRTLGG